MTCFNNFSIKLEYGTAYVYMPHNSDFMKSFDDRYAYWSDTKKCWIVDEKMVDDLSALICDFLKKTAVKNDVFIDTEDGKAYIYTPYNPDYVHKIKDLGARWNGIKKCWVVDERMVDDARKIILECYGFTDIEPNKTVDLLLTMPDHVVEKEEKPIIFFGKIVANAVGFDSVRNPDPDVYYLEGYQFSNHEYKGRVWNSAIKANSKIKILNVNRNLYEKSLSSMEKSGIKVEVISEEAKDLEALKKEKEKLLKRIVEIDKCLNEK